MHLQTTVLVGYLASRHPAGAEVILMGLRKQEPSERHLSEQG